MNIYEIRDELNEMAVNFKIGKLQDIRKEIKKLNWIRKGYLFGKTSDKPKGWTFHFGGRKEIQFNVGFQNEEIIRYGLAFSLKRGISLTDLSILFKRIDILNNLINIHSEWFESYKMWNHYKGEKSDITVVKNIPEDWKKDGYFIFFGKLIEESKIDFNEILNTLDDMLKIYIEVESRYYKNELKKE